MPSKHSEIVAFKLNAGSGQVLWQVYQACRPATYIPDVSWEAGYTVRRSEAAWLVVNIQQLEVKQRLWGRQNSEAAQIFVDDADPVKVTRALLPVTEVYVEAPTGTASWERETHCITRPDQSFFMVGCRYGPDAQDQWRFSLLTTSAGRDLRDVVEREPFVVPQNHWKAFLDRDPTGAEFNFPSRPDSWQVTKLESRRALFTA